MIHPGGLANPHSVAPPVRATSSQSALPFSKTAGQTPSQLNLPPPMVYSQAMPSQHLPPSSGTVQQQSSIQWPDSTPILFTDLTPQHYRNQGHLQHTIQQNTAYPCIPQLCPQQFFVSFNSQNQLQYINHNPHIRAMRNPVITGSPPPPVQPHYTDPSVYTNKNSPAQQCFSNQPTSNQSSANLLTVEPTIPHIASASQPASLSDNSTTDSTESRSSQSDSTPAPKRPRLSSHGTLAPILSEIEQFEPCITSLPTVAGECSQTVGILSSTQQNQNTADQVGRGTQNMLTIDHDIHKKLTPDTVSSSEFAHPQLSTLPPISAQNFDLVYNTLYSVRSKWYDFGLALGLPTDALDSIAVDEYHKTEGCLRRMLCKRMEMKRLTWYEVVVALRRPAVNRNDLAEKIEKGDLNYSNKAGAVYDLSGEPTLEELCSLPVEKVWYQLGVWLGVEDIILSQGKPYWPSDKLEWIFTAFLNLPIGTKQYEELVKELSLELQQQAEELLKESKVNELISLFPSSKQTAAEELAKKRQDHKYPILITALVKVGQRKVAEEVCLIKGTLYRKYLC